MFTRNKDAVGAFQAFIRDQHFPCVAAKSALAMQGMRIVVADDLSNDHADTRILSALRAAPERTMGFVSTVVLFPLTPPLTEIVFETHLWARIQALCDADRFRFAWDPHVSSNPRSDNFAVSIGGTAYFVVGLHPDSSRLARRAPMAALAFNPHAQFRRLKQDGKYQRLRTVVRERDIAIQGDVNPMLAEHGEASEAAQYSGRQVFANWDCPFQSHAGKPS
jgi:FPC/CPF motif-containing protein YcgG